VVPLRRNVYGRISYDAYGNITAETNASAAPDPGLAGGTS
jgi:hypothetical protein